MVADGVVHCSLRAPEGYDLSAMLDLARPFLRSGGGHRSAAGMSFEPSRLAFIRETLNRGAQAQAANLEPPALSLDGESMADIPDARTLASLEPFGSAFPEAALRMAGRLSQAAASFGEGHCKLRLEAQNSDLVWFSADPSIHRLGSGDTVDLAVCPQDHPRWGRSWLVKSPLAGGRA
jgi:single-stranded-DNA-specific exonuclease